jgi:hypothetical protein
VERTEIQGEYRGGTKGHPRIHREKSLIRAERQRAEVAEKGACKGV